MRDFRLYLLLNNNNNNNNNNIDNNNTSRSDSSNKRGDWNHFKITQAIPEQHIRKARSLGTAKTAILGTAHKLWEVLM